MLKKHCIESGHDSCTIDCYLMMNAQRMKFIPLEKSLHQFTVRQRVVVFYKRLRLQAHYRNQPNIIPTIQDPFLQILPQDSKWTPTPDQ